MRKSLSVLAAISVFGASAAIADPCPPHRPGASYPWDVAGVMSGDQWAELAVNVDTKGKVTDCKIASGNLENEMGFWVCRSILAQGEFDPQIKDGVAVPSTRTEHFTVLGMHHRDVNAAARKRWFAAHPGERQSCYPD